MNVILFDDPTIRVNLLPFTFTRPVAAIRCGILTIAEKWEHRLKCTVSFCMTEYLQTKFPIATTDDNVWINGAVCPDEKLCKEITKLAPGEGLIQGSRVIALRTPDKDWPEVINGKMTNYHETLNIVDQPWRIYQLNGEQIRADVSIVSEGRASKTIADAHTKVYSPANVFVEDGVYIRAAIINAETGPVYLGKNSIVQEGAILRGPIALGEGAHINMGAKLRGNVTVGPFCKVGGEVSNSVLFSNSNKAHDGFLGCAVVGEWCNLGADTNTSNLKNNYDNVKLWSYARKGFTDTGQQFLGLMMGDHSKCGINTMFNTGTTVGVSANIFGAGFPRNFVPSFAWGGAGGWSTFEIEKAFDTASRVLARRSQSLSSEDRQILTHIFKTESEFRFWETK